MMVPQGYDSITLNHWLWYKYRCHECVPAEFQRLFEEIIKRAKPEFMQIRPYGNIGDRKCDGLLKAAGTIFQVYSPDELTQAEVQRKIDEDLDGAVAHWRDELRKWVFVYNVRRGLPPDIPSHLTKKKKQYKEIDIDHLSSDALWEMARGLTLQQRTEILGAPSGYEHLFLAASASTGDIKEALEKGWFVIVHDVMTPINLQSVLKALEPSAPFGAPIWIRPTVGDLPWHEAASYQRTAILEAVRKSRDVLPRFAVFSLSPIPLCVHLGYVLSDRLEVRYFQYNREEKNWNWPANPSPVDEKLIIRGVPKKPVRSECEALIRISLSATIDREDTIEACGDLPVQIDVSVKSPDVMWLRSADQLRYLSQVFREVLTSIRKFVPGCQRIHLFYAGPTGGAVAIGQQINPRMSPPVELYEFSYQGRPHYQHALSLKESP